MSETKHTQFSAPPPLAALLNLHGKTALVTGGAQGIGAAIVDRLAEAGARVMLTDLDATHAAVWADHQRALGRDVTAMQSDVSTKGEATRVVAATVAQYGGLDILVNNAGIFPFSPMLDTDEAFWDRVMAVNERATFFHAQAAARQMSGKGHGGVIVNVSSIDALHPTGNLVHYDTSKGGVGMMTRSMALELGHLAIRVNAVAPGSVQTPGAASAMTGLSAEQMAAVGTAFNARVPLGRAGHVDEIARVVLFLASDLAAYVTGVTVVADGGYLLS